MGFNPKRFICQTAALMLVYFFLIGCTSHPLSSETELQTNSPGTFDSLVLSESGSTVTVRDAEGEKKLDKSPKRVVCLYNSILDLWYQSGGEAIARVAGDTELPPAAASLPEVGSMSSVGLEQVAALEPDLVLLTATLDGQWEIAKGLKANNIPYLLCDLRKDPFGSFGRYSYLFSKLNGLDSHYQDVIEPILSQCLEITERTKAVPDQPTVAVLFSAPRYVKAETGLSQLGQMVEMLGAVNILAPDELPSDGSVRVDLSFEVLLARNPDYILVATMGDEEKCRTTFEQTLSSNPAWVELSAVKENRMYYVPKEYSLNKPNQRYPEAFHYLAELLYPNLDF